MLFIPLFVLAELMALAIVIMMGVWMGKYQGGFAWRENPSVEFNYHPLFMSIAFILLYRNGILMYRVLPNTKKLYVKLIHGSFFVGAIAFSVVALVAAFDSHNLVDDPIPNMYTLHSWIGIVTVGLFCCQWLLGFLLFLIPGMPPFLKKFYLPHHQFWGSALLGCAAASMLSGITEKAIFKIDSIGYKDKTPEAILINTMGLMIGIFAVLVIYIVNHPGYKRIEPSEDDD